MDLLIFGGLVWLARGLVRSAEAAGGSTGSRACRATACCSGSTCASTRSVASSSSSIGGHPVRAGPEPGAAAFGADRDGRASGRWSSSTTAPTRPVRAAGPARPPKRPRAESRGEVARARPLPSLSSANSPRRTPASHRHRAPGRRGRRRTKPRSSCGHSVDANLAGHDSHGIIQIPTYIDRIQVGHIVPGAPWTIVQESPTTTVIDGHWGFGYTVTERAMQLTIDKADRANVAAATVFRQGHIGRLASYTLMAAQADMIGLITADSGRSAKQVAPFGGREARIGHQSAVDRHAVRPRRAAVPGHGHLGRRGGQDLAGGLARRVDPAGLDRRPRRASRRPIRRSSARAGRCCRWAAAKATRAAAWRPSSRSCAGC